MTIGDIPPSLTWNDAIGYLMPRLFEGYVIAHTPTKYLAGSAKMTIEWPKHKAALHLTHNEHKSCYNTVQQEIEAGGFGYAEECWVSLEQRQKAIDTNECWVLQWYPDTPVGFCLMSAADLDVLIAAANVL